MPFVIACRCAPLAAPLVEQRLVWCEITAVVRWRCRWWRTPACPLLALALCLVLVTRRCVRSHGCSVDSVLLVMHGVPLDVASLCPVGAGDHGCGADVVLMQACVPLACLALRFIACRCARSPRRCAA